MVFCWKNTQVRRWIGDCTPWRRKERTCDGLGIQGADLENARVPTPNPARDLNPRPSLHKPTFSELALEKELQHEDTTRFSIFSRHTVVPDLAPSFGAQSIQPSLSFTERVLRYVTKDTQQYLFPELNSEKVTPVAPPAPSPRKYSFRSSRAMKKGGAGTKLTISAPIYREFPTLTLSRPPMARHWSGGSTRTITGSGSSEPSPTLTVPLTDCAETLSSFASEDINTIDYYHNDEFTRRHFDDFDDRRKRLSCASQYSGISIMSTDTGRISLAQVAMRPESRPTLQIIGPCESPRRVVVVHY